MPNQSTKKQKNKNKQKQQQLMPMCYRRYRRQTSVLLDTADLSVHSLYLPCSPYRLSVSSVVYLDSFVWEYVFFFTAPDFLHILKTLFFSFFLLFFSLAYICASVQTHAAGVWKTTPTGISEDDQRESTIGCANGREQYLHPHRHLCLESWDPPDSAKKTQAEYEKQL